uniref:Uncharacterized protein n=1 Tax=Octopus bimaculoides TaxID=37653 RepID=A0A0L8GDA2_OCTBM
MYIYMTFVQVGLWPEWTHLISYLMSGNEIKWSLLATVKPLIGKLVSSAYVRVWKFFFSMGNKSYTYINMNTHAHTDLRHSFPYTHTYILSAILLLPHIMIILSLFFLIRKRKME